MDIQSIGSILRLIRARLDKGGIRDFNSQLGPAESGAAVAMNRRSPTWGITGMVSTAICHTMCAGIG